jgi:hypothetical protein
VSTGPAKIADMRAYKGWCRSAGVHFKMLTARAATNATVTTEIADCNIMIILVQRVSGNVSVGLKAVAWVTKRTSSQRTVVPTAGRPHPVPSSARTGNRGDPSDRKPGRGPPRSNSNYHRAHAMLVR